MASTSKIKNVATKILLKYGLKKGNFLCSPMLLENVLSMLCWGKNRRTLDKSVPGEQSRTLDQLLGFLGTRSLEEISFTPSFRLLSQLLQTNTNKGGPVVQLANGVWVGERFPLVPSYKEILDYKYKAQAKSLDFSDPVRAAKLLNSWAEEKTKGLISNIVEPEDFSDASDSTAPVLVLGNALYFKGSWQNPFNTRRTKNRKFHLMDGNTVSVPFMTSEKSFRYGTFDRFKILEVPYQCSSSEDSERFSMYFFLPKEKDGFQNMIEKFDSESTLFERDFFLEQKRLDELWIPKFKLSFKFEADHAMKEMGLTLPFHPLNQELTGIVELPHMDWIYISKILQKSCIEVDEQGTEAAACTFAFAGVGSSMFRPPPETFVADRPFLFMIRENTTRAVLFIGSMLNPKEEENELVF